MDLHKVEVPTSINELRCKLLSIKGLKMPLSSDDKLKWDQSPHGSPF